MELTDVTLPNLCLAFIPIYCLSSFFGIMPVTLHFSWKDCGSLRSHIPMTSSLFRVVFAVLLLIFTTLYGISAPVYIVQTSLPEWYPKGIFVRKSFFANESTIDPNSDTKQSLIMKILYPILVSLTSISIRTVAVCSMRKGLKNFFAKINEADRFLRRMENFERVVNTRAHLLYSVGLCCFFFVMSVPIHLNYLVTAVLLNNLYGLMWCIVLVWSTMAAFCGDILFSFCAYLIRVRFKVINVTLCNIKTDEKNFHKFHQTGGYEGIINWSLNYLPKEEMNKKYELLKFQINLRQGTGFADTIEIYRHCHRSLCELVRNLNGMFKLHLLMTLAACFLISLFNIYFAMFGYVATTTKKQSIKIQSKLFRSICWNLFYIVRFLAMTGTAHFTTQQGVKTRYLISSLNNRYLDADSKEELALFMNHISNTKIEFTACDFFSLNTRLITSAIAAGTTYLVILVQFHSDKDS